MTLALHSVCATLFSEVLQWYVHVHNVHALIWCGVMYGSTYSIPLSLQPCSSFG